MSAPKLASASKACPGSVKIAPTKSSGLAINSSADATSAVITIGFPLSSVRMSTGVSGGKS
jgi:hypothetical protein